MFYVAISKFGVWVTRNYFHSDCKMSLYHSPPSVFVKNLLSTRFVLSTVLDQNGSKKCFILADKYQLPFTSIHWWNKLDWKCWDRRRNTRQSETGVIRWKSNRTEYIQLFNTWAVHNLLIVLWGKSLNERKIIALKKITWPTFCIYLYHGAKCLFTFVFNL